MGKNPAFLFYPADWARDLEVHPLEIEGAWIRICCKLWWSDTPGSISFSLTKWARVMRVGEKKSKTILDYLLNQKICDGDNQNGIYTIVSRRMVKDDYIRNIRREAGQKGGNPALKKSDILDKQNLVNPNPTLSVSVSVSDSKIKENTPYSPPSSNGESTVKEPLKTSSVASLPDGFDKFWNCYPKKIGKAAACKKWRTLQKEKKLPPLESIVKAIEEQKACEQWRKDGGQFIPHPATWLNQGRWEDQIQKQVPRGLDAIRKMAEERRSPQ